MSSLWATIRWPFRLAREISERRSRARDGLVVAVDTRALRDPLAGIGWYTKSLLEALADREGLVLRLYGPRLTSPRDLPDDLPDIRGPAIEEVRWGAPADLVVPARWLVPVLKLIAPWLAAAERPDLLFLPNFVPPRTLRRVRAPWCAVVHDTAWHDLPDTLAEQTRRDLERHLPATLRRAVRVVTGARAVRDRLVEERLVERRRVRVVPHGPGHLVPGGAAADAASDEQRESYVLHVGTLEPRKNVATLLRAWRGLQEIEPPVVAGWPRLVLCGAPGWKNDELLPDLDRGVAEGWLEVTGRVDDPRLEAYYRGAMLLVSASLLEGFGLPLVEAMGCGTPLLVSDIPVFREVAGEAARYVPPMDAAAWQRALGELLVDPEARDSMAAAGRERVGELSWSRAAERTSDVWHEMVQDPGAETRPDGEE